MDKKETVEDKIQGERLIVNTNEEQAVKIHEKGETNKEQRLSAAAVWPGRRADSFSTQGWAPARAISAVHHQRLLVAFLGPFRQDGLRRLHRFGTGAA